MSSWDDNKLRRVIDSRRRGTPGKPLGRQIETFLHKVVWPKQKKLTSLGQAWRELLPQPLWEHSCLESFQRGQLRIMVDDAGVLYELNLLAREGLVDQLQEMCPGLGLSGIKLVRGRWYREDEDGTRIPIY